MKEGGKIIHDEAVVDQHTAEAQRGAAPRGVQAHARTPLLVHRAQQRSNSAAAEDIFELVDPLTV